MKRFALATALALTAAPLLTAQDAEGWLKKMEGQANRAVDVEAQTTIDTEDMQAKGYSQISYADAHHFRVDERMEMRVASMGMDRPMGVSRKIVADGTTLWIEMVNQAMGGGQVMKQSLAEMDKAAAAAAEVSFSGAPDAHPVKQVLMLAKLTDFDSVEVKDGAVRLSGQLTEEGVRMMTGNPMMANAGIDRITFVLDEKTVFPREIILGDPEKPSMTSKFQNAYFPEKPEMSSYEYTPPEGMQVVDMALVNQGQQEAEEF